MCRIVGILKYFVGGNARKPFWSNIDSLAGSLSGSQILARSPILAPPSLSSLFQLADVAAAVCVGPFWPPCGKSPTFPGGIAVRALVNRHACVFQTSLQGGQNHIKCILMNLINQRLAKIFQLPLRLSDEVGAVEACNLNQMWVARKQNPQLRSTTWNRASEICSEAQK